MSTRGVHEFPVWNNNLYLFAQMLFKPVGSVTPPPSIGKYTGGSTSGFPGMGMRHGRGLTQAQTQKITDAVQSDIADLNTKLADAQKEAIKAALAKDATEASVKAKIDAVVAIQVKIAMLRYTKGIKPIAIDITDEQKTQLNIWVPRDITNCLSAASAWARLHARRWNAGGGRGAAPKSN